MASSFKQFVTRRAEWAFLYTPGGAKYVVDAGFPRTRVTVLMNTLATEELQAALDAVSDAEVAAFHTRHRTLPDRTALFLGAVDPVKGTDMIVEAAFAASRELPGTVVAIAGDGPASARLAEEQSRGVPIRVLGRLDGPGKAVALRACRVIAAPRSIGLVAVDALASRTPVLTVDNAMHGPEAEYLVDMDNSIWLPAGVSASKYGQELAGILAAPDRLAQLQEGCRESAERLSLSNMVQRFVDGVLDWREVRAAGL